MEHKKFFVKDFIQYASPCFGCGQALSFRVWCRDKTALTDPYGTITPVVTNKHIQISLSNKYISQLSLWIFPKDNSFLTNDNVAFNNYVDKRNLRLVAECSCGTHFHTNHLDFQTFNRVVGATTLYYERVVVTDKDTTYTLSSDFNTNKTMAAVHKKFYSMGVSASYLPSPPPRSPMEFQLPLLPKYKLRDKQHLIDKLKTYLLFS